MAKTRGEAQKGPEGLANRRRADTEKAGEHVAAAQKLGKRKRVDASVSDVGSTNTAPAIDLVQKPKQDEQPSILTDSSADPSNESATVIPPSAPEIPSDLLISHNVIPSSINTGTQIQKKVKRVLEILGDTVVDSAARPSVVMLYAKASASSKMISIAEIAKRELSKYGGQWYQYISVEALMEPRKQKCSQTSPNVNVLGAKKSQQDGVEEDENMDTTFETMKTPFERAIEGNSKVRAVPLMRIYLAKSKLESLKRSTSEQTNTLTTKSK